MKVGSLKVYHAVAPRILNVGIADVPFPGNGPIENLCASRNLMNLERDLFFDNTQRFANSIASDAPTERIKLAYHAIHLIANVNGF